jgi:Rho GDP-dissociation inhibitor
MIGSFGPSPEPVTKVVSLDSPLNAEQPSFFDLQLLSTHALNTLPHYRPTQFAAEESPSGTLARSGSYVARSRIVDDDGTVWLDFEWGEF